MPYSTKQQQAILNCLNARREEPVSAAELRRGGRPVDLATVNYRRTLFSGLCEARAKKEREHGDK
jgi:hypothetical protein